MNDHLSEENMAKYAAEGLKGYFLLKIHAHLNQCFSCARVIRPYLKAAKEEPLSTCSIFDPCGHNTVFTRCIMCKDIVCLDHMKDVEEFFEKTDIFSLPPVDITLMQGLLCIQCQVTISLKIAGIMIQIAPDTEEQKQSLMALFSNTIE